MWFGLLGPLCVRCDDGVLPVTAARQRVVLAALAIRAGHVVAFEDLARSIWDGQPPVNARVAVRNHVCRLRRLFGPAGDRIVTSPPGYLLDASDDEVDLLAFGRLCRDGGVALRAGDWQRASDVLGKALECWRGVPLVDIPSRVIRDEHVPALDSLRLQATEWRFEAGLNLGQHSVLVPELQALAREQPLRERFAEMLMLALYRGGRQTEALAAYQSSRQMLVDELGVEPGPELQELHRRILAADPALIQPSYPVYSSRPEMNGQGGAPLDSPEPRPMAAPAPLVPQQLPACVRHFTGRRDELATLAILLTEADERGAMVIAVIHGTAGVGKTALAVYWAHRVADRFPDGQLYVDLRGFDPSGIPVTATEAIRDFLHALGVPAGQIPAGQAAQTAMYRTMTAGKRLLIVLDNAREVDQVLPLLPGSPGCLVLVTSRTKLAGLAAAEGAQLLPLDLPSADEARDLLAGRLGARVLAAEPDAVGDLIGLCARLPLALSIAAARAAAHPRLPLAALAAELRDAAGRLDALDAGTAASSARVVFSWSCQGLTAPAARMFRLLGVHPGPGISVPAAASLAGLPPRQAQAALRELDQASLVTEHVPGRYSLHDLLRVYAAEQAQCGDSAEQRRAAVGRMFGHYLRTANVADLAMDPTQDIRDFGPPEPGLTLETISGCDQALAWFAAEHKVLLAITRLAAHTGFDTYAQQLPWTLVQFLDRGGHWHDLVAAQQIALTASARTGDLEGQARARRSLGRACIMLGENGLARDHLGQAVELSRHLGDQVGEARAYISLSVVCEREHKLDESLANSLRALDLAEAAGHPVLRAMACNNAGYDYAVLGDFQRALGYCQRALDLHGHLESPSLKASTWDSLGYIYHHLGDYHQATTCYLQASTLFHDLGARYLGARTLSKLGDTYHAAGDTESARAAWQQALTSLRDLNHPDATEPQAKLQSLPHFSGEAPASPARAPSL